VTFALPTEHLHLPAVYPQQQFMPAVLPATAIYARRLAATAIRNSKTRPRHSLLATNYTPLFTF
jgi:hypothetical protein